MRIIPALALLSLLLVPVDAAAAPNGSYYLHIADGTVAISGKCLDVNNSGTTNGTIVQLWDCNSTGAQQWRVRSDGSVQNPQSGLWLNNPGASTTPGTRLNIWTCNGSAAQAWRFR